MSVKRKGLCCRAFTLPYSPTRLKRLAALFSGDRELQFMISSLIPLGRHRRNPVFPLIRNAGGARTHFYTCRNFDKQSGDCTVYKTRPGMCKRYPGLFQRCQYQEFYPCCCAASPNMNKGESIVVKKKIAKKTIKKTSKKTPKKSAPKKRNPTLEAPSVPVRVETEPDPDDKRELSDWDDSVEAEEPDPYDLDDEAPDEEVP